MEKGNDPLVSNSFNIKASTFSFTIILNQTASKPNDFLWFWSQAGKARPGGQAGRTGVLRGLTIAHYYDTALTVTGGHWVLEDCEICRYDPNPAAPDPATLRPWP